MKKKIKILCFGDSNTYGYIAGRGGRYNAHCRWPGLLRQQLGKQYQVIEEGLCGRTTIFDDRFEPGKSGLEKIGEVIERHAPIDILILMLGSNDCKAQFGVSAQQIAEGMEQVLVKAKSSVEDAFKTLLIAPASITEDIMQSGFGPEFGARSIEVSRQLAHEYEALAGRYGCGFLDASQVVKPGRLDGLHLDANAHHALAEAVYEALRKLNL